jgi:8-oxo-dGTP diphosphatase
MTIPEQPTINNSDDTTKKQTIIRAAGGLIWRKGPQGEPELAVIRRARYGDEWSLPKGKLQDGESWENAALREVQEETGCRTRLTTFAGVSAYPTENGPKVVVYWNMEPIGEGQPPADKEESKEVAWLSLSEAIRRLRYENDIRLVRTNSAPTPSWSQSIIRRLPHLFISTSSARLGQALPAFQLELEHRIVRTTRHSGEPFWTPLALKALAQAEAARQVGGVDEGWHLFQVAQRLEFFGMEAEEKKLRARSLSAESNKKLSGWRRKTIEGLCQKLCGELDPDPMLLVALSQLRDEKLANQYQKLGMWRRQLEILLLVLLSAVALFLIANWWAPLQLTSDASGEPGVLAAAALLGAMGACLSAISGLGKAALDSRIPELLNQLLVAALRPALGAAAALGVYMILVSRFLDLGPVTVVRALAVAFASGFTERLVFRAIAAVTGSREPEEGKQS